VKGEDAALAARLAVRTRSRVRRYIATSHGSSPRRTQTGTNSTIIPGYRRASPNV
jgi:hypothetical protein